MSKASLEPDFGDPYLVLGLEQTATESDINKAFRKLSLLLHPDKQGGKSERERSAIAKRFHDINQAKEFLLDPSRRGPYDIQRGSRLRRQQQDRQREANISERRLEMKQQLAEREARLRREGGTAAPKKSKAVSDEQLLQKLRREGKRKRDEYAEKATEDEYMRLRKMRSKESSAIQSRQIRLKWSRKRITISPSEHSIAEMLSLKFGNVIKVEMIGSKGNQAIVTFESSASCQPSVDFYAEHQEMRAFLVREDTEEAHNDHQSTNTILHESETIEEQRHRQAEEREQLMREMEDEENGSSKVPSTSAESVYPVFPFEFPLTEDVASMGPFEKLEYFEKRLFDDLISKGLIAPTHIKL